MVQIRTLRFWEWLKPLRLLFMVQRTIRPPALSVLQCPWLFFSLLYDKLFHREGLVVAEVDGEVVGMIAFSVKRAERLDYVAEIWDMAVDPNYRRRGIGTMLKLEAHRRLREMGFRKVKSYTRWENEAMRGLNMKLGYRIVSGEICMEKDLLEQV